MTIRIEELGAGDRPLADGIVIAGLGQRRLGRPDCSWAAVDTRSNEVVGTASLWHQGPIDPDGRPCAALGDYQAANAEAGSALIDAVCAEAARGGAKRIVGPLDGSTWHRYRLVTQSDGRVAFPLEPANPTRWVEDFTDAGFVEALGYGSVDVADVSRLAGRLEDYSERTEWNGLLIRPFDKDDPDGELFRLYELCTESFRDNPYFSEIGRAEFEDIYRPLVPALDSRFVYLAEAGDRLAGFLFAYGHGDTVIAKSAAVHPDFRDSRLGGYLTRRATKAAVLSGMRKMILALMHEDNISFRWAQTLGPVFRRYALFAKDL